MYEGLEILRENAALVIVGALGILLITTLIALAYTSLQENFIIDWRGGVFVSKLIKGTPRLYLDKGVYNISYIDSNNIRLLIITSLDNKIIEASLKDVNRGGRIYPLFNITMYMCPYEIQVYRGSKNVTDLILSSKALNINRENSECIITFNGLKIYSLGYVSDRGFFIFNVTNASTYSLYYIVVGVKGVNIGQEGLREDMNVATTPSGTQGATEILSRTTPLQEPVKITPNDSSSWSIKMKYLIGLALSILMVVSLVYEYGRSRKSD
ncbi:MAG: hypothetical protein GSR85_03655 [Desulfurococcales archaeon]|nr:hypothetical protein [Desulfurococcales archaeon]